jgi:ribosomal small subunit protein bTHX
MGKGNIKSFTGKLFRKSYGKYRLRKKKRKRNNLGLPKKLRNAIRKHIKQSYSRISWDITKRHEDMTTSALLSHIATCEWNDSCGWKWKITVDPIGSTKLETISGADGIISVNVENNGIVKNKSIIFQAKKENNNKTKGLERQIKDMKKFLPGGNMLIFYSKDGCFGQTVGKGRETEKIDFADYISDVFLKCANGCLGVKCEDIINRLESIKNNKNNSHHPADSILVSIDAKKRSIKQI